MDRATDASLTTDKMRVISLMYHDVAATGAAHESGFPGADAALYKLERSQLDQHLAAIARVREAPIRVFDLPTTIMTMPWTITFDDGGVSAYSYVADRLDALGWCGHFFVATDYIGASGFMSRAQIRELHRRGHIIGSHSCSHPLQMTNCGWRQLCSEWSMSVNILADLLGVPVRLASVPGGQFSRRVAEAGAQAGIKTLFTSEPTSKCTVFAGCLILGRYAIRRRTSSQTAAAMAAGKVAPRMRQMLLWNVKKVGKALGGKAYLKAREALIRQLADQ